MNSLYIQQHRCPTFNAPSATPRAQRCATVRVACAAQLEKRYKSPSSSTASTELQYLESYTTVVPDTLLLQNIEEIEAPKAATVSSAVLAGILRTPGALQEYKVREATVYHLKANKGEGGALFADLPHLAQHAGLYLDALYLPCSLASRMPSTTTNATIRVAMTDWPASSTRQR